MSAGRLIELALLRLHPSVALRLVPRRRRSRLLTAALCHPGRAGRFASVVRSPPVVGPAVIVTVHRGPVTALAYFLERIPGDVLALHRWTIPPRPGMRMIEVGDTAGERALAFYDAYRVLSNGGSVFLALDGRGNSLARITVAQRELTVARGALELARLTGTPIVLVTPYWRGTGVHVTASDPIPPGPESAMTVALGKAIEAALQDGPRDPEDLFELSLAASPSAEGVLGDRLPQTLVTDLPVGGDGNRPRRDDEHPPRRESDRFGQRA